MSECGVICFVVGSNSLIYMSSSKHNTLCIIVKINISACILVKKIHTAQDIFYRSNYTKSTIGLKVDIS